MVFNITVEPQDPGVPDSTHATQTGYFATPIPGNSANPPYHESYSNTDRPTSLGPVDPLAVPRRKYRHRRPRGNIERADTHARAQRSPHRSRKMEDFTVHIASDSESGFAVDSDDEVVRRIRDDHGHYELYDEWTNLPYPDEPRPKDSSRRQHQRRHRSTGGTKSGSPMYAPNPTTRVEIKPTSPFTSDDESIDFKHAQPNQNDRPDKRVKSQTRTRLELQAIRRGLRFLRAQCLLLESDLSFTEPGLLDADIAEKIEKDLDGLIDLVRGLRVGNERAPGGGKAAETEKTENMSHIEQQEAKSTPVWPERETTRIRGMTRAEQRRAI